MAHRRVSGWSRLAAYGSLLVLVPTTSPTTYAREQEEPRAGAESRPARPSETALAEGIAALDAGRLDEAEARLREVVESEPIEPRAWLGLALVDEQRERPVDALIAARRAIELGSEDARAHLVAARLLVRLGSRERALEELQRAIELAPLDPEPRVLAALLLRDLGRDEEAIALLEDGWELGARSTAAAEELVFLYLRNARPAEAVRAAERAERAELESPRLVLAHGLALAASSDRRSEARPWLEQALEELGAEATAERFRAHLELAGLLLEAGSPAEAVSHLRAADRLQPETKEVLFRLGSALRATGELDEARDVLARFRELQSAEALPGEPDRVESEIAAGLAKAQSEANENLLDEALRTLDPLLRAHPNDVRLLDLTAKVVFSLGHAREALVFVTKGRALEPGNVELAFLDGVFRLQLGDLEAARSALLQAVAIDPGLADGHRLLGRIALDLEEWTEAAATYERALASGASSPNVHREYALALERLGRGEEAAEQRRLASEAAPP